MRFAATLWHKPFFWHNQKSMWDTFTHILSRLLTIAWFTGVGLMVLTIPACMYKIFSALWEADDADEDQGVYDKPRRT